MKILSLFALLSFTVAIKHKHQHQSESAPVSDTFVATEVTTKDVSNQGLDPQYYIIEAKFGTLDLATIEGDIDLTDSFN